MKIGKTQNWSTLITNISVIAGIAFLALELNQNSQMMAAQTRATITQEIIHLTEREQDTNAGQVLRKINAGEELTEQENDTASYLLVLRLRHWENMYYQHQVGLFDDSEFQAIFAAMENNFQAPYMKELWREQRFMYASEFQALVDPMAEH